MSLETMPAASGGTSPAALVSPAAVSPKVNGTRRARQSMCHRSPCPFHDRYSACAMLIICATIGAAPPLSLDFIATDTDLRRASMLESVSTVKARVLTFVSQPSANTSGGGQSLEPVTCSLVFFLMVQLWNSIQFHTRSSVSLQNSCLGDLVQLHDGIDAILQVLPLVSGVLNLPPMTLPSVTPELPTHCDAWTFCATWHWLQLVMVSA